MPISANQLEKRINEIEDRLIKNEPYGEFYNYEDINLNLYPTPNDSINSQSLRTTSMEAKHN